MIDQLAESEFVDSWEKLAPALVVVLNVLGCATSLLLLKILRMTRLHVNSRFLLNSWATCYLCQFVIHIFIFCLNCSMENMTKNKADPPIRITMYTLGTTAQFTSTIFELCISLERFISTSRPSQYYSRDSDRKVLYPASLLLCAGVFFWRYCATEDGDHTSFCVILIILDLSTITMNSFAKTYCNHIYEKLLGNASLNARYQVKESLQLAHSMQPVILFAPILVFCYKTNEELDCVSRWFYIPYAYMELAYFTTLTIVSIFIIAKFIHIHPRLRRRAMMLSQRIRGLPITVTSQTEAIALKDRVDEGKFYFEKLKQTWN